MHLQTYTILVVAALLMDFIFIFQEDLFQKLNHTKGRVNEVITKRRKDPNLRAIEEINEALLKV